MASRTDRRIRYSQNFLHDRRLVDSVVAASSILPDDLVIEIGPGDGAITRALIERCRHVIAVELDPAQVERLDRRLGAHQNLTVFAADFLDFPLPQSRYKVFASIPYRATAAIVGKLTTGVAPPADSYLVVQREAAERFAGRPVGTLAATRIAPWFEVSIVHRFRRSDFRPAPAVDSVLLRLEQRIQPLVPAGQRARYEALVTAVFGAWQPSVGAALERLLPSSVVGQALRDLGAMMEKRPGQVGPEEWVALFGALEDMDDARIWVVIGRTARKQERDRAAIDQRHRTSTHRPGDDGRGQG
jgi:23S rRNA (adenine-N6)-dimethyltransferase